MMIRMLFGLLLLFYTTFGFSGQYLVQTKNSEVVSSILKVAKTTMQKGRLHIVELNDKDAHQWKFALSVLNLDQIHVEEFSSYKGEGPDQRIVAILEKVSKDRLEKTMENLVSYRTRRLGTVDNQKVTDQIALTFEQLGLDTVKHCFKPNECNVVAIKRNFTKNKLAPILIVMGHFDSVGQSFAGADDNASGTAGLVEAATLLAPLKLKHEIHFLATNGEERGLVGAEAYVKYLKNNDMISRVGQVINMDMIGYNPVNKMNIETNKEYLPQARQIAHLVRTYTSIEPVLTSPAWGGDHVPFIRSGMYSVLIIENWATANPCYHKACDTMEKIDLNYVSDLVKVVLAQILTVDQIPEN